MSQSAPNLQPIRQISKGFRASCQSPVALESIPPDTYLYTMFLPKMPAWAMACFPNWLWHLPRDRKVLYLTFDDGPSPGITPWVLDTLAEYGAKATFFCIGDKVGRHPEIVQQVADQGHSIGNHTHNHLNLWKTKLNLYMENMRRCQSALHEVLGQPVTLFRPPYGKMTPRAGRLLRATHQVVMWDVISQDYDAGLSPEVVAQNVIGHAGPGSIVVFHDSEKADANMRPALKATLAHFAGLGYRFEAIGGLTSPSQT